MFLLLLSLFFFMFKSSRLIFMLLSIEFLFFSLLLSYSFVFESVLFFYFLFFGAVSSIVGVVLFFFCIKSYGCDKVMFYIFMILSLILVLDVLSYYYLLLVYLVCNFLFTGSFFIVL